MKNFSQRFSSDAHDINRDLLDQSMTRLFDIAYHIMTQEKRATLSTSVLQRAAALLFADADLAKQIVEEAVQKYEEFQAINPKLNEKPKDEKKKVKVDISKESKIKNSNKDKSDKSDKDAKKIKEEVKNEKKDKVEKDVKTGPKSKKVKV